MAFIKLDPAHPDRIPTALSDAQVQALIDAAVLIERTRCIQIVRDEVARWDARNGVGWSWEKVRDNILAAVDMVK
jgi:hypothetical protein